LLLKKVCGNFVFLKLENAAILTYCGVFYAGNFFRVQNYCSQLFVTYQSNLQF
jgi:hypothetical protein